MNIKEIRQEFEMTDMGEWTSLMKKYESDPRSGVQKLLLSCQKKMQACEKENERLGMMPLRKSTEKNMNVSVVSMKQDGDLLQALW